MKIILLLFLTFIFSCDGQSNEVKKQPIKESKLNKHNSSFKINDGLSRGNPSEKIEGAIGIVTLSDDYRFGDTISVYQSNGTLLTVLKKSEEYQVIALKCIAQTSLFYQVILDNGKKGLISRYSKHIKFQTWEDHILSLFSVKFNEDSNPLMTKANSQGNRLRFDRDEYYHPDQIKGEWLRVKWGSENHWSYGWIRWKNKGKLIIEVYYFA